MKEEGEGSGFLLLVTDKRVVLRSENRSILFRPRLASINPHSINPRYLLFFVFFNFLRPIYKNTFVVFDVFNYRKDKSATQTINGVCTHSNVLFMRVIVVRFKAGDFNLEVQKKCSSRLFTNRQS